MMEQAKIWHYFQTTQPDSFSGAGARLYYLVTRLPPNSLAINIGVGSGQFERMAQARGHQPISIDPDTESLHAAHSSGEIPSVTAKIQSLPFRDGAMDVVVASEVLEHLDASTLEQGLAEIGRILKPGGIFLGSVPFEEDLKANEVVCPHCGTVFHKVGHLRSYGFTAMKSLLETHFDHVVLRRKAFMHTADLSLKKRLIGVVRNALVSAGILTRETSLVFEAVKRA